MRELKTCEECKFCVLQDTGYSNWTVEGTEFECRKNLHPEGSFDRWYGEDERLAFAQECPGFSAGDRICMDVDGDNYCDLTDEQKLIFDRKHPSINQDPS